MTMSVLSMPEAIQELERQARAFRAMADQADGEAAKGFRELAAERDEKIAGLRASTTAKPTTALPPQLCEPSTWPCSPLLAIRHKHDDRSATLLHTVGQPRYVIHALCRDVRAMLDQGQDPTAMFPGSAESSCADVAIEWEVDPDQSGCG